LFCARNSSSVGHPGSELEVEVDDEAIADGASSELRMLVRFFVLLVMVVIQLFFFLAGLGK
jgi:hypothetical protein